MVARKGATETWGKEHYGLDTRYLRGVPLISVENLNKVLLPRLLPSITYT